MRLHRAILLCCGFSLALRWGCSTEALAMTRPEQAMAALRHLDYRDSQPGEERIRVKTSSLLLVSPIGEQWSTQAIASVDAISGASPYYQASDLRQMKDFRRALDLSLTHYQDNDAFTLGSSYSGEVDYLSRSMYGLWSRSTPSKNLSGSVGFSTTSDQINPVNRVVRDARRHTGQVLIGVTAVLSPQDLVQINVSRNQAQGYLSDPYKFADERPDSRTATALLVRWHHHVKATRASLRLSHRQLHNDWGIRSATTALDYVHPLSEGLSLTPLLRWYQQSAANFYVPPSQSQYPFGPRLGTLYSEDQRLARFGALTLGLQLTYRWGADWTTDLKFEHYEQRATWHLNGGSEGFVPFRARLLQWGLAKRF